MIFSFIIILRVLIHVGIDWGGQNVLMRNTYFNTFLDYIPQYTRIDLLNIQPSC